MRRTRERGRKREKEEGREGEREELIFVLTCHVPAFANCSLQKQSLHLRLKRGSINIKLEKLFQE
jgi:hypothetical protein